MTIVFAGLLFLVIVGVVIALVARAWRKREQQNVDGGLDLIPYLLMALAVSVAGFALAGLARASLTPDRLAGRPTGEIAGSLAGLVVATPVAYLLWRRQSRRRTAHPGTPGWPIYLALIELVFLTAFMVAVAGLADSITSNPGSVWTDLLVYGGIVGFHWWAERTAPVRKHPGELPRLVGSGVALIALATGLIGTVNWLLSEGFEAVWGLFRVPEPVVPLALTIAGAPIWAWRWLPHWDEEPNVFRNTYLAVVTSVSSIMAITAVVTIVVTVLTFLLGMAGRAQEHFGFFPEALSFALVGGGIWFHHQHRFSPGRAGDRRGYEYVMAATGLGALVGSGTALVDAAFEGRLAGNGQVLVGLACAVVAAGWVWLWFWRKAQAAPRGEEVGAMPRRAYLIGMAIVTGLTAAGSLIATLVVVFRALLGAEGATVDSLRLPIVLTVTSGLAAWHLVTQIRSDAALRTSTEIKPFDVTVICSHPGGLATMIPSEATVRVVYRADDAGVIDEEMAAAIVAEVGHRSSLVWVDDTGFRVAAARES